LQRLRRALRADRDEWEHESDVPNVRKFEKHGSTFGLCGARQPNESVKRIVASVWFRRLLRRRLRLPLRKDAQDCSRALPIREIFSRRIHLHMEL
jgi:hypothetical protein